MLEGFYSEATALPVLLLFKSVLAHRAQTPNCAFSPTDEAVPKPHAHALDKVLTDCGVLGAKTPKWSAAWQLIPDDVSHTFPDHCNARARLKSRRVVCGEPADGLGLIIRNHFPASAGRFRKVSRCDIQRRWPPNSHAATKYFNSVMFIYAWCSLCNQYHVLQFNWLLSFDVTINYEQFARFCLVHCVINKFHCTVVDFSYLERLNGGFGYVSTN